jgi:hypothetical protein
LAEIMASFASRSKPGLGPEYRSSPIISAGHGIVLGKSGVCFNALATQEWIRKITLMSESRDI